MQQTQRAFVCFTSPDSATKARIGLHGSTVDGKQLYVANYELPEIRKKQQAEAKDKADFMTMRRQNAPAFDPSLFARPDTIQLIEQIMQLLQRQVGQRGMQNNYNNRPQMGYQNRGPRGQSYPGGQQQQFPQRGNYQGQQMQRPMQPQQMVPPQISQVIAQPLAQPQIVISTHGLQGPSVPLHHQDPQIALYN